MIRHRFSPPDERSDTDSVNNTNTEIITRNNERAVVLSSMDGKSKKLLLLTHFYNYYNI